MYARLVLMAGALTLTLARLCRDPARYRDSQSGIVEAAAEHTSEDTCEVASRWWGRAELDSADLIVRYPVLRSQSPQAQILGLALASHVRNPDYT